MITDFQDPSAPSEFDVDVCIVGAGAAGTALALEFDGSPYRTLVLESGGLDPEPATQALYDSAVVGLSHNGVHGGRARIFGGTTTLWAGQALPLDPFDFDTREWVPESGWPIDYADIQPYYERAAMIMSLPAVTHDKRSWPSALPAPAPYDETTFRPLYSQFTARPNFATTYRSTLSESQNVAVLLHANVTSLNANEDASRVTGATLRTLSGRAGHVRARTVIVCCGGIETTRLLLASNQVAPNGLGNDHDVLGRYFQEHVHAKVYLTPRRRAQLERLFNTRRVDYGLVYPKIASTFDFQKTHRLLNVAADLGYELGDDSPIDAAKTLLGWARAPRGRSFPTGALAAAARGAGTLARATYRYALQKRKLSEVGRPFLSLQSESVPNPQSRIRLSTERDALGVPKTVLDWQITDHEVHTLNVFARALADEFDRLDLADLDLSSFPLPTDPARLDDHVNDSYHHMGSTRMHSDPRRGVVDGECRVHGIENLYLASSSVFPTGGFSNPTLTLLALTFRLADRLKETLRRSPASAASFHS
jgi:choline dehydrogenase-like flavoprotein